MFILKEIASKANPIELQFNTLKEAMENVELQIEYSKNLIGKNTEANKVTSVSNNNWHSVKFENKIQHNISWSIYYKNGQKIEFSATISEK